MINIIEACYQNEMGDVVTIKALDVLATTTAPSVHDVTINDCSFN